MNKINMLVILLCIAFGACTNNKESFWQLSSPDKNLKMEVLLEDGQLFYTASIKQENNFKQVIQKSPMGIKCAEVDFSTNLSFIEASNIKEINENYSVISGKELKIQSLANEQTISFSADGNQSFNATYRVYNDGIAFRYEFPEMGNHGFEITSETTGFKLGAGKAWLQPFDDVAMFGPAYERYYEEGVMIGQKSPQKQGWCFPALFETYNTWILLTEAGLDGSFYGSHLKTGQEDGMYSINIGNENEPSEVCVSGANISPWRVAIIGNNLQTIVSSSIVKNLSPECRIKDTAWIKPGRSSWSWPTDRDSPKDYNKLKNYVDLSSEMGWEYSLVDANWNMMQNGDAKKLVDYATTKNVGILLWYNSGGSHNTVSEQPRNLMEKKEIRRAEFAKLREWGVKGVKIDFFHSDAPYMMKLYQEILEDAADFQLMVGFHGCTIPRGWSRTYPNLLTMESVRGAENYIFDEHYPQRAPICNTILPLTRNVVGSMDYTPVFFSNVKYPHLTTYGHELALSVIFESGWLHFADNAVTYRNLPDALKKFLKEIPVVWDETHYVNGFPGKEIVFARKHNNTWYIAGINGENKDKILQLELPFLPDENQRAEIIIDGSTPKSFSTETLEVNNKEAFELSLLPYGGFTMIVTIN